MHDVVLLFCIDQEYDLLIIQTDTTAINPFDHSNAVTITQITDGIMQQERNQTHDNQFKVCVMNRQIVCYLQQHQYLAFIYFKSLYT